MGWASYWVSGCRAQSAARRSREGHSFLLNYYFLYIERYRAPLLRIRTLRRRRRFDCRPHRPCRATGRDTDVRRTWVALSPVRPTCAPRGALWHTHRTCEHEAYGSDLTPLARLPRWPERRSNRPDSPQILTTIHHQNFFASKGSVCWWLLVPEHSVFASWTASRSSANPANHLAHLAPALPQIIPLKPTCQSGYAASVAARSHIDGSSTPICSIPRSPHKQPSGVPLCFH